MNNTEFKQLVKDKVNPSLWEIYEKSLTHSDYSHERSFLQISMLSTIREHDKTIKEAKQALKRLQEMKVPDVASYKKQCAYQSHCLTSIGFALYELGKYNEALDYYDKSLDTRYENSVYYYKGLALEKLEKYQEAQDCYKKVIDENPIVIDSVKRESRCKSNLT